MRVGKIVPTLVSVGFLGGCAIVADPLTEQEMAIQAEADLSYIYHQENVLTGPVSIYEAMARAVLFNLDSRLRIMEQALSNRQFDVSLYELMPNLSGELRRSWRNNLNASSSVSVESGRESLEPSTSQEKKYDSGNLTIAWNILDFGVSWVGARQQSNRALIAQEKRRKVVHQIIQDVRLAFWRAVAAQRLMHRTEPLIAELEAALRDSQTIERLQLQSPLTALRYQKTLLATIKRLQTLRADLISARTQLASLMNVPLSQEFDLVDANGDVRELPELSLTVEQIEEVALRRRPELREEGYQKRISRDEVRRAFLRLLPGVELDAGYNYDSNKYVTNNRWTDYSASITWNLTNLLSGPSMIDAARAQESVGHARRMALNMAVLSQAHIAWHGYHQARSQWQTAEALASIETRINQQIKAAVEAEQQGELDAILANVNNVVTDLEADLAYAELRNALGLIFVTMGADPLPVVRKNMTVAQVADLLKYTEKRWLAGETPRMMLLNEVVEEEMAFDDFSAEGQAGAEAVVSPVVVGSGAALTAPAAATEPVAGEPVAGSDEDSWINDLLTITW